MLLSAWNTRQIIQCRTNPLCCVVARSLCKPIYPRVTTWFTRPTAQRIIFKKRVKTVRQNRADLDPDLNEHCVCAWHTFTGRSWNRKNQNRWTKHSCKLHFAVARPDVDMLLIEPVLINVPITKNCSRANVRIGANVTCGAFINANGTRYTFDRVDQGVIDFYFRQWIQIKDLIAPF